MLAVTCVGSRGIGVAGSFPCRLTTGRFSGNVFGAGGYWQPPPYFSEFFGMGVAGPPLGTRPSAGSLFTATFGAEGFVS
jgi:hypothetical protein